MTPEKSFYQFYLHTLINSLHPFIHQGCSYESCCKEQPESKKLPS